MELPHLPDMLFAQNGLTLEHDEGFGIRFCPIEALKTVNAQEDLVHVSMSKEWLEARANHANINKIAKRYDWTFTPTNYKGTLLNNGTWPMSSITFSCLFTFLNKVTFDKMTAVSICRTWAIINI